MTAEDGRRSASVPIAVPAVAAVLSALGTVALVVGGASASGPRFVLLRLPAVIAAAWLAGRAARHQTDWRARRPWTLVAASIAGFALVDIVHLAGGAAFMPWLAPWPVAAAVAAVLLLPPAVSRLADRLSHALDVGLMTSAAAMVFFQLLLRPAFDGINVVLAAVCAPATVALTAAAASLLLRLPKDRRRLTYQLLALGYLLLAVAIGTVAVPGEHPAIAQVGFAGYMALVAAAGFFELELAPAIVPHRELVVLRPPGRWWQAAVGTGAIVLVLGAWTGGPGGTILASGAAMLLATTAFRLRRAGTELARLRRERAMLAQDARFRTLVEQSADLIFVVDATGMLTFASPSVREGLGYRSAQLLGMPVLDFVHPEDAAEAGSRLRECLAGSRPVRGRWRMRRSDQSYIHVEAVCANLNGDEHVRGLVLTVRDVSERTALEAQLTHRAFHDPLTGLANRALFEDRVQHALARRRGELGRLGVLFVDLDHFKQVNDQYGHAAGDALLRAAAQRLVGGLRAFDTAARLGGDEFAVLIDDVSRQDEVMQVAERIIRAFAAPFAFDGHEMSTSASIGVAMAAVGQSADDLLRSADLAMYLAKKRGGGQAVLFEPAMFTAATTRQELQRDLRYALERGELSLVYQPIHALDTRAMIGAEALLRWVHPTRGPIAPSEFVPLAEEAGLMVDIGHWVIRTACFDLQTWRSRRPVPLPLRVWINLSSRQLPEACLYDQLAQAIAESGISPDAIVLELTERMLLQHKDRVAPLMERLKSLGIALAIDDFGTGDSSLGHLHRLPIDILKIDRTFVDAIASDEHASTLARTVVSLGELMSFDIVAEGIESQEQAERLLALGCHAGQGYLFGMPMTAGELPAFAERYGGSFSVV
ncbi:MAG: EAL domain-containing protein [Acidobacteriota bacterium]